MTETADSSLLCPFTLKPISSAKRDDVAVLCQNNPLLTPPTENHCGHSCTLSKLVPYLHDGSAAKLCPVCQTLPVTFICDHQSYTFLDHWHQMHAYEKRDGSSDGFGGKIVTFRYGSTSYFLWVHSQSPQSSSCSNLFGSGSNAMDRINKVLGVKHGLKVIHKGKIIHPANTKQNELYNEISEQLLDISNADLIHRRKRPSLVVMGLRQQVNVALRDKTNDASGKSYHIIMQLLSPWYLLSLFSSGLRWAIHTTTSLFGGICLFFRSILNPPQAETVN